LPSCRVWVVRVWLTVGGSAATAAQPTASAVAAG
jgi:hypothetical protein